MSLVSSGKHNFEGTIIQSNKYYFVNKLLFYIDSTDPYSSFSGDLDTLIVLSLTWTYVTVRLSPALQYPLKEIAMRTMAPYSPVFSPISNFKNLKAIQCFFCSILLLKPSNSLKYISSWEASNPSLKNFQNILCNPKVHYGVFKARKLVLIVSHMNRVDTTISYSLAPDTILQHPVYLFLLLAAIVIAHSSSPYCKYVQYMFRPNWPSSGVHLKMATYAETCNAENCDNNRSYT
jgi:hypothetical protein